MEEFKWSGVLGTFAANRHFGCTEVTSHKVWCMVELILMVTAKWLMEVYP